LDCNIGLLGEVKQHTLLWYFLTCAQIHAVTMRIYNENLLDNTPLLPTNRYEGHSF